MNEDEISLIERIKRAWCWLVQCRAIWTPARPGEPVFVEWACVRNRWHRGPHRDISGEWATEGHPKEP